MTVPGSAAGNDGEDADHTAVPMKAHAGGTEPSPAASLDAAIGAVSSSVPAGGDDLSSDLFDSLPSLGASSLVRHSALSLLGVHKTHMLGLEGVPALRGVTLHVGRGEWVIILGPSGCGKSTLLSVSGCIDGPTRGEVYIGGTRIDARTPDSVLAATRLRTLGFIFQAFNLLPTLSALENVELPLMLAGRGTRASRRRRAVALLSRVGMRERLTHTPAQMSGGEQQRVTIARALANSPSILVADEPTGDLDSVNTAIVMKILTDLNQREGVTMLMVTHDVALKSYAHRVLHMVDGKIAREERIPDFVREAALAELNASQPVQALQALEARAREVRRAEREATRFARGVRGAGGEEEDEDAVSDDEDGVTAATLQAVDAQMRRARSSGGAASASRSSAGTSAGVMHRVWEWGASLLPSRGSRVEAAPASSSQPVASAAAPMVVPHDYASRAPVAAVPAAAAQHNPLLHISPAAGAHALMSTAPTQAHSGTLLPGMSTSTGLSGVASISHAMFASPSAAGTTRRVVRTPDSYATHTYDTRMRASDAERAAVRARAQAEREAAQRAAVLEAQRQRMMAPQSWANVPPAGLRVGEPAADANGVAADYGGEVTTPLASSSPRMTV